MTKAKFNILVLNEINHGRCGCLAKDRFVNICYKHAPPDIQKQLARDVKV